MVVSHHRLLDVLPSPAPLPLPPPSATLNASAPPPRPFPLPKRHHHRAPPPPGIDGHRLPELVPTALAPLPYPLSTL
jgi:hypothetical protein